MGTDRAGRARRRAGRRTRHSHRYRTRVRKRAGRRPCTAAPSSPRLLAAAVLRRSSWCRGMDHHCIGSRPCQLDYDRAARRRCGRDLGELDERTRHPRRGPQRDPAARSERGHRPRARRHPRPAVGRQRQPPGQGAPRRAAHRPGRSRSSHPLDGADTGGRCLLRRCLQPPQPHRRSARRLRQEPHARTPRGQRGLGLPHRDRARPALRRYPLPRPPL